jgi:hypothetical protein
MAKSPAPELKGLARKVGNATPRSSAKSGCNLNPLMLSEMVKDNSDVTTTCVYNAMHFCIVGVNSI